MIAVIYCRVSTKEQTQNLSLPTQRAACEAYCRRQGMEVLRVFTERGESAKTADRPQLQAMLVRGSLTASVTFRLPDDSTYQTALRPDLTHIVGPWQRGAVE